MGTHFAVRTSIMLMEHRAVKVRMSRARRAGGVALIAFVSACARAGDNDEANPSADGGIAIPVTLDADSSDRVTDAVATSAPEIPSGANGGESPVAPVPEAAAIEDDATTSKGVANDSGVAEPDATSPAIEGIGDQSGQPSGGDAASDDSIVSDGTPEDPSVICASTCGGCCDSSGMCQSGMDDQACGASGSTCQNCAGAGQSCASQICVSASEPQPPPSPPTPAPDATAPRCDVSECSNLCVPYFVQCCKTDATCGCALLFPRGPCN